MGTPASSPTSTTRGTHECAHDPEVEEFYQKCAELERETGFTAEELSSFLALMRTTVTPRVRKDQTEVPNG